MLLNYSAPRIAPNIVAAPTSNLDINSILGLTPSKYSGLQSVGDTGYYYGNNRMYEPYTVTSSPSYGIYGPYGGFGYGPYGVNQSNSNRAEGTITVGNQSFRPVDVDITGFSKNKVGDTDIYEYSPSMAYVYSKAPQPTYTPTPSASSFLSAPTMPSYAGNYGAGKFLNTGNLLGFNFTPAQTTSSPGQSPAI